MIMFSYLKFECENLNYSSIFLDVWKNVYIEFRNKICFFNIYIYKENLSGNWVLFGEFME